MGEGAAQGAPEGAQSSEGAAPPKGKRGGAGRGQGRKPKLRAAPSSLGEVDLKAALAAPAPQEIEPLASSKAKAAIGVLVKLMQFGRSEAVKVTAANKVLDRGYGKPSTEAGGFAQLSLFPVGLAIDVARANEIRDEARRFAPLAIEVLGAIAERGENEAARAAAAASIIDRGIGTVATAKVPTGVAAKPLGKKEEAAEAARQAALGKFATPPPPTRTAADTVQ